MKKTFLLLLALHMFISGFSQLKRNVRGVWLTTYYNIDWPQKNLTTQQQQASLLKILDTLYSVGINTIYFQVRSQCDAMYNSNIDPWSADLTGKQGVAPNPYWDPLEFIIKECHKKNIELHAWINPYRATSNSLPVSPQHVSVKHPEWLLKTGTLNPALPEVRNYINEVVADIVKRYDVDGIHFDDYFYPEGAFNDDEYFAKFKGGFSSKADWRRNNVDLLIKQISESISRLKPWVKFGISPTGIYQNSKDPLIGSDTRGKQHFSELFSDTKKWLREGWIDYLEPQLYWHFNQPGSEFHLLTKWWNNNSFNRDMYIGLGAYKAGIYDGWKNASEIPKQIRFALSSEMKNIKGVSIFSTASIINNQMNLKDSLKLVFSDPVLIPTMPWKDSIVPKSPFNLSVLKQNGINILQWSNSVENNEMDKTFKNIIYGSNEFPVKRNSQNFVALIPAANKYIDSSKGYKYYIVTSLDRLQNESNDEEAVSPFTLPTAEVKLFVNLKNNKGITFRWEDNDFQSAQEYSLERSNDNSNFTFVKKFMPVAATMFFDLPNIEGENYFRILRIDKGGKVFSNTVKFYQPVAVQSKVSVIPAAPEEKVITRTATAAVNPQSIAAVLKSYPKGRQITVTINTTGIIQYEVYGASNNKITWGKINSNSVNTKIMIPGTATLALGQYKLIMKKENLQESSIFEVQ